MKNKKHFIGIIALVVIIVSLQVACDNGGSSEKSFNGTWVYGSTDGDWGFVFSGSSFQMFDGGVDIASGTFTYTDTTITFNTEDGSWTQGCILTDTYFDLTRLSPSDDYWNGRFYKK